MKSPGTDERLVVGVMTGTSLDGMDAALVRIAGRGLAMRAESVSHIACPLGSVAGRLRQAAAQQPMPAGEFARLAWEFGERHVEVIGKLLAESGRGSQLKALGDRGSHPSPAPLPEREGALAVDLICVHGQTVFHAPPHSWQLVNTAPIAAKFGCPVVSDLRQADLARGGQGAPITPIADLILFGDGTRSRAIVNLGGYCNMTVLPAGRQSSLDHLGGFDVCACNHVLNAVAHIALGKPYDEGGARAERGSMNDAMARSLHARLDVQRAAGRSLGTGDEAQAWAKDAHKQLAADDLLATAAAAVGGCIGQAVRGAGVEECILAGGGALNRALVHRIREASGLPAERVRLSDEIGVPVQAREAVCFAVLGALCADGVPITRPQVTGCSAPAPISGVWSGLRSPRHECAPR